jgi:hypothetical protein
MISVQTASAPSAAPLTHNQGFFRHCALPIALRRTLSAHQQTANRYQRSFGRIISRVDRSRRESGEEF